MILGENLSLQTDIILERMKLKSQVRKWRILLIIVLVGFLLTLSSGVAKKSLSFSPHIARISFEGIILNDSERVKTIKEILENNKIKAVIVSIDSPGGTAVGGEVAYQSLQKLAAKKPVIAVMNGMATSAAYLVALPSERIFAHNATITGSIGVIVEIPNVKGLSDKIGVKMDVIRTGTQKGEPSMFNDMSPETRAILTLSANDFMNYFVDAVAKSRKLPPEKVRILADGRVYGSTQALNNGLIDQIGTEEDAIFWLIEKHKLDKNIQIQDYSLEPEMPPLQHFLNGLSGINLIPNLFSAKGLLSIWPHAAINMKN
jgi:protease IV